MIACLARVYYMVEEEYNATQDKKSVNIKNGIVILLLQHTNILCRSTKPVRAVQEVNKSIDAMKRLLCKDMV